MPYRAKSTCRRPGCSRPIDVPGYCAQHQQFASGWASSNSANNTERGYGWLWRQQREKVMSRDGGLCQICLKKNKVTPATEVDHILGKARGGTDNDENLQAICNECHKQKTIADRRYTKK